MELPTQGCEVTDLPAPSLVAVRPTTHPGLLKVSVSELITVNQDLNAGKSNSVDDSELISQLEASPLYADTSDVEELLDSSGVDAFPPITSTMAWDSSAFPEFEGEIRYQTGHSDTEQEQYSAKVASSDRQLTVKGRSVIRKYLAAATPVQLPAGHATVAFNEDQVHTILRTIADESVISSYHMMKSLLLHATHGASQDKKVFPGVAPHLLVNPMTVRGTRVALGDTPLTATQVDRLTQTRILTNWVPFLGLTR